MEATTITHQLEYTVYVDGGDSRFGTTEDPHAALAEAERLKREDPGALISVVIDVRD